MTREKKTEKTLTLDKGLEQALVPVEEQPYPVPGNWCWVRIGYLVKILNGFAFKSKLYEDNGIRIIRITNVQDGYIEDESPVFYPLSTQEKIKKYMLVEGDLLLSLTGNVGRTAILTSDMLPAALNQRVACIRCNNQNINTRFLFYFFLRKQFQDECIKNAKGSAQLNMSTEWLKDQPLCVPPLLEQQRIVDRIESLYVKLDEAKEKAQMALDGFETRKAAILHKAFTGEFTAQWRKEHDIGMESWEIKRFDEVATIRSNLVDPADFPNLPHIAPDNIEKKTGVLLEYHTIAEDGVTSGKHRFYPGQILYSKIRPYLSKVVVIDFDGLCSADMYPIEAKINAKCLWYYMLSEEFLEQASSAGSRSVLPKINQKELSALTVKLPTSGDEQSEIVRILDYLFAKEQQAQETITVVLEQIDLIKKSILTQAFRGNLGTNNSGEDSSLELIKKTFLETIDGDSILKPKKIERIEVEFVPKTIMEALVVGVRLTPENLKAETGLQIDDFYEQLKELIDSGQIIEIRMDGESYLEAVHADRQTEN